MEKSEKKTEQSIPLLDAIEWSNICVTGVIEEMTKNRTEEIFEETKAKLCFNYEIHPTTTPRNLEKCKKD